MTVQILVGDCRDVLRTLPAESVHCVVTSPPYWGLRDYGIGKDAFGLEPSYQLYVEHAVEIFREVWRVLRKDGTLWLNLGDCYATGAGKVGERPGGGAQGDRWAGATPERGERTRALRDGRHAGKHTAMAARGPMTQPNRMPQPGLKPKDLVGIPWRVALALQDDGWWLRRDIIWAKPAPMPESVRDRCTTAHEYLFHLTKAERYYYDFEAIMEPSSPDSHARAARGRSDKHKWADGGPGHQTIAVASPSSGRMVKRPRKAVSNHVHGRVKNNASFDAAVTTSDLVAMRNKRTVWTVGSEAFSEAHFATYPPALVEPCILAGCPKGGTVLDPFGGAGTTGLVADRLQRNAILIELNPEYAAMARRRIDGDAPLLSYSEAAE